jgi:DNA-directed RNA polymerase subunit RPC12/RpoP
LNPFSKYIDCINCGNELSSINELTFRTPDMIRCDFCGQKYPGMRRKIRYTKTAVTLAFIAVALFLAIFSWINLGVGIGLFSLLPLLLIYYFALGYAVKKIFHRF